MNKKQKKQYDKIIKKGPVPYDESNNETSKLENNDEGGSKLEKKSHASYKEYPFKLHNPQCINGELQIKVSFNFLYKADSDPIRIAFQKATFKNFKGDEYASNNELTIFDINKVQSSIKCTIDVDSKQNFHMAFIEIVLCSTKGIKYYVIFKLDYPDKVILHEINSCEMSSGEIFKFKSLLTNVAAPNPIHDSKIDKEFPQIYKYLAALNTEKQFLINGGGKKYRVTNGRYLTSDQNSYYYFFELEAELHLADDSPIKLMVNSNSTKGSVLTCENFQIIVALNSYLGQNIAVAYISVEPWKLLEALYNSVKRAAYDIKNPIVMTLVNKGPKLATNEPINNVATGQETAIEMANSNPITIIWGPPGTGKTHTMAKYAVKCIEAGKKVLIVSHSNVSVDGVTKKIHQLMYKAGKEKDLNNGKVLRYGYVRDEELQELDCVRSFAYAQSKFPDKRDELEKKQKELSLVKKKHGLNSKASVTLTKEVGNLVKFFKELEGSFVTKASVITTTISKVSIDKLFEGDMYDVVMFDEISMANIPQVICAASHAKEHFVCVGDFMQLSPIAQSAAKTTLSEDIFKFLNISDGIKLHNHPWLVMLNVQRRMHPYIAKFPSKAVYNNLLKSAKSTIANTTEIVEAQPFNGSVINLIDLAGSYCAAWKNSDNSRFNILSALLSFSTAIFAEPNVESVSIITPYAAQTRLIRALILDYREKRRSIDLKCATVHQFQGSESDVIIFDAVESYPKKKPGWLLDKDLNQVKRLINVAVTRARGKFIVVANARFWNDNYVGSQHTLYKLISHIEQYGHVVRKKEYNNLENYIRMLSAERNLLFYLHPAEYMGKLIEDISKAKESIIVSLPIGALELCDGLDKSLLKAMGRGVNLSIKYADDKDLPKFWKDNGSLSEDAIFPLIIIDNTITWYGAPQADWKFKDKNKALLTPCKIACRINGKYTTEMIKALTSIEINNAIANFKNTGGLAEYISTHRYCKLCKKPLKLTKGKSGKTILWCSDCKETELLSPDEINHYINLYDINCPNCGGKLNASIGKYGIYVKCEEGHFPKIETI